MTDCVLGYTSKYVLKKEKKNEIAWYLNDVPTANVDLLLTYFQYFLDVEDIK